MIASGIDCGGIDEVAMGMGMEVEATKVAMEEGEGIGEGRRRGSRTWTRGVVVVAVCTRLRTI